MKFAGSSGGPSEKRYSFSNFGFSTILLTFIAICIMTFGVLAIVTANADLKLSKKVAEKSVGYHRAEETSYEYLTIIEEKLSESYSRSSSEQYTEDIKAQLGALDFGTVTETEDSLLYGWDVPITDNQNLSVIIELQNYELVSQNGLYHIQSWCSVHIEDDDVIIDDTLNLMGSD